MHSRKFATAFLLVSCLCGGGLAAESALLRSEIIGINVAPVIANLNGDIVSYTAGQEAAKLDPEGDATIMDPDSADFSNGHVMATVTTNFQFAEDLLGISASLGISLLGFNVRDGGVTFGVYSWNPDLATLEVFLDADATVDRTERLLRALHYSNSNPSATKAPRTVSVTLDDGDGGLSLNNDVIIDFGTDCVFYSGFELTDLACD